MLFWNALAFFEDWTGVGTLITGSSVFSKSSLNIWKFMVHVLLKPGLENFEHYFTSVWDESNCAVVWAFFGIAFLWDCNENWPFPVLWPLLSQFQKCYSKMCVSWKGTFGHSGHSGSGFTHSLPQLSTFCLTEGIYLNHLERHSSYCTSQGKRLQGTKPKGSFNFLWGMIK